LLAVATPWRKTSPGRSRARRLRFLGSMINTTVYRGLDDVHGADFGSL
jgi:hypothetical protein